MQQNRPFIYNPSQKIEKSFAKASDGLDEGIQDIIDYKQKEYEFAKKQYEDVELLKKDLNVFDNEVITKRANDLLGKASSMIKKDGKIDYNNAGEIRREIEAIRDAKRNSAIKAKVVQEANSLVFKNAADMTDVFSTANQINNILRDPEKLFSPKDISEDVMNVYKKGINMQKRISDKIDDYLESRSGGGVDTWNSERGDVMKSEYKDIPGLTAVKGQYVAKDMTSEDGSKIDPWNTLIQQIISPEEMQLFAEQSGHANMFDKNPVNLLKPLFQSKINSSVKSSVGLYKEAAEVKIQQVNASKAKELRSVQYLELAKERLLLAEKLGNARVNKDSVLIQKYQKELNAYDSVAAREGRFYDEATQTYIYDETRDTKAKETDVLAKIFGENGGNLEPDKNPVPKPLPKPNNGKTPTPNKTFKAKTSTGGR